MPKQKTPRTPAQIEAAKRWVASRVNNKKRKAQGLPPTPKVERAPKPTLSSENPAFALARLRFNDLKATMVALILDKEHISAEASAKAWEEYKIAMAPVWEEYNTAIAQAKLKRDAK